MISPQKSFVLEPQYFCSKDVEKFLLKKKGRLWKVIRIAPLTVACHSLDCWFFPLKIVEDCEGYFCLVYLCWLLTLRGQYNSRKVPSCFLFVSLNRKSYSKLTTYHFEIYNIIILYCQRFSNLNTATYE
jgi:hypothetical protein